MMSVLEEIAEEENRVENKNSESKPTASLPVHLTKENVKWKHR